MFSATFILLLAYAYMAGLFAIARYGDTRAAAGQSIVASPTIYALSLAVYCTSWTFFGSVGRAASSGIDFLAIYLGPTLTFLLGWPLLRKIVRISKNNRITSIADFIASRYGKSFTLGALVTIIAVIGVLPYISLQLKAISASYQILARYPTIAMPRDALPMSIFQDTEFYATLVMAIFAILFSTRDIDASERHEGIIAAIAFESIVKIVAFTAVGAYITFVVYGGFADVFRAAERSLDSARLFTIMGVSGHASWVALMVLSMAAIVVLPRQFHVLVVENVDERHIRHAMWLLPLYLLVINIFVMPIALAGLMAFAGQGVDADTYVLTLPMREGRAGLALVAFIGGLAAATGMIILESVAIATMVSNDIVLPLVLRWGGERVGGQKDLTKLILAVRRSTILFVLMLAYVYASTIGGSYALVTIGLVSFVAAAQFAPVILAGLYWKGATKAGALAALAGGFAVWLYTLLLPSFARSGWMSAGFVDRGLFDLALLKPYAFLGVTGFDPITHATIWTLVVNVALLVGVSLFTTPGAVEHTQAIKFVDVFKLEKADRRGGTVRATVGDLTELLVKVLGAQRADSIVQRLTNGPNGPLDPKTPAGASLVHAVELQLAGAIGAASARILLALVLRDELTSMDDVTRILDEASQIVVYARQLEEKSEALEKATEDLIAANARLKQLDKLKDDFMATVSHEIRTPLTSIRSFSEILRDNPDLDAGQREEFVTILVQESERLTRLVNDILDLAKMEAGKTDWQIMRVPLEPVLRQGLQATSGLFAKQPAIRLVVDLAPNLPDVDVDPDRLIQVIVNLVSNAVKFCNQADGLVEVRAQREDDHVRVDIRDNGPGIQEEDQQLIFERFTQAGSVLTEKPKGTGLGLPISRQILERFGGRISVASRPGQGATFSIVLPVAAAVAKS